MAEFTAQPNAKQDEFTVCQPSRSGSTRPKAETTGGSLGAINRPLRKDPGNFGDETTGAVFNTNWPIIRGYRDGYVATSPVGKFFPNSYFLYDMAGNVYEWTSSFYERFPNAPPGEKPYGARGTYPGKRSADELPSLRCAFRNPVLPNTRMAFLGFRIAADIPSLK